MPTDAAPHCAIPSVPRTLAARRHTTSVIFALALALALCVPAASMAAPRYTYLDIDYVNLDPDAFRSIDGFGLSGAYALHSHVHVAGGYTRLSAGGIRRTDLAATLGVNLPIAPMTHLVGRAGMTRNEFRAAGAGTVKDNVLLLQGGIRSMVLSTLEVSGILSFADYDDARTSLAMSLAYQATGAVALTAGADIASDDAIYRVGFRVAL